MALSTFFWFIHAQIVFFGDIMKSVLQFTVTRTVFHIGNLVEHVYLHLLMVWVWSIIQFVINFLQLLTAQIWDITFVFVLRAIFIFNCLRLDLRLRLTNWLFIKSNVSYSNVFMKVPLFVDIWAFKIDTFCVFDLRLFEWVNALSFELRLNLGILIFNLWNKFICELRFCRIICYHTWLCYKALLLWKFFIELWVN